MKHPVLLSYFVLYKKTKNRIAEQVLPGGLVSGRGRMWGRV
jgi:hypothetical protein